MSTFIVCLFLGSLLGLSRAKEVTTAAECGLSNLNGEELQSTTLEEGMLAKLGNFPWHAGIYFKNGGDWSQSCSGNLVSNRHVLTAAHCVVSTTCLHCKPSPQEVGDVMLAMGTTHRKWDTTEGLKRKVAKIHLHPRFTGQSTNYENDIAVLELESEVVPNRNVMPACLDLSRAHLEQLNTDKTHLGYVTGWAIMRECPDRFCDPSEELKFTPTAIMGFAECFNSIQAIKRLLVARLTSDKYCATNGSVLQKISGSGMTFDINGHHYINGIASIKLKLESEEKVLYNYLGFTNVSHHFDWLTSVIH